MGNHGAGLSYPGSTAVARANVGGHTESGKK